MQTTLPFPHAASLYQLVRAHPGSLSRLEPLGITREHLPLSLKAAAGAVHQPVERLATAIER